MMTLAQTGLEFARIWEAVRRLQTADLATLTRTLRGLPPDAARTVAARTEERRRLLWEESSEADRQAFLAVAERLDL